MSASFLENSHNLSELQDSALTLAVHSSTPIEKPREREVDVEEMLNDPKYIKDCWKFRIMKMALENLAYKESKIKLEPEIIKYIKQIIGEYTFRPSSSQLHLCPQVPNIHFRLGLILNRDQNNFLDQLLIGEIYKFLAETERVLKRVFADDVDLISTLSFSENPSEILLEFVQSLKSDEERLDDEIKGLERKRDKELSKYSKANDEMFEMTRSFESRIMSRDKLKSFKNYEEYLKLEEESLTTKLRRDGMRQTVEENPPKIVSELTEAYSRLLQAKFQMETKVEELEAKKERIEELGPDFKLLLSEWKELEFSIKDKEYVLNQLELQEREEKKIGKNPTDSLNDSLDFANLSLSESFS